MLEKFGGKMKGIMLGIGMLAGGEGIANAQPPEKPPQQMTEKAHTGIKARADKSLRHLTIETKDNEKIRLTREKQKTIEEILELFGKKDDQAARKIATKEVEDLLAESSLQGPVDRKIEALQIFAARIKVKFYAEHGNKEKQQPNQAKSSDEKKVVKVEAGTRGHLSKVLEDGRLEVDYRLENEGRKIVTNGGMAIEIQKDNTIVSFNPLKYLRKDDNFYTQWGKLGGLRQNAAEGLIQTLYVQGQIQKSLDQNSMEAKNLAELIKKSVKMFEHRYGITLENLPVM